MPIHAAIKVCMSCSGQTRLSDALACADLEAKLFTWSPDELRSLRAAELVDLVQRLYTKVDEGPHPRTKDQSIQAILAARPPDSDAEASEQEDGRATPYPRTSQENSSEGTDSSSTDSQQGPRVGTRSTGAAANTPRRRVPKRRSGVRRQEPTPPPSASDEDGDAESDAGEATEVEEDDAEQTPRAASAQTTSTAMARRSSEVEMPPPPVPFRRPGANGTPTLKVNTGPSALNGFHKSFGATQGPSIPGATPVAHRTRGHVRPTRMPSPPPHGSAHGLRLQRTLFGPRIDEQVVDRPRETGDEDSAMADERDASAGDAAGSDSETGSQGYDSEGESCNSSGQTLRRRGSTRRANVAVAADGQVKGRRRSGRTAKQVITPPSDADEESGGEAEHDSHDQARGTKGKRVVEAASHQRQAGRTLRHDKVVRLSRVKKPAPAMEDVEMQDGAESDDDADEYEPDETGENHEGEPPLLCKLLFMPQPDQLYFSQKTKSI